MYYSDKPIESRENDLLGRAQFSKHLARSLLKINLSESFTVSITGKWGTGKTSVLNMVQKEINDFSKKMADNEKPLIMRFEPWNYSDCNQLLQQFFSQLSSTISLKSNDKSLKVVGDKLEQYASSFDLLQYIPVAGKYLSIIPGIIKTIGGKIKKKSEIRLNDMSVQKDALVDALKKQNHRIIIFIDDIDRLSNDQIRLVFQLVNSVAGFPNVIYVLSFDKRIVVNALTAVQNCDGSEYLEKIIQIPFDLPEVEKAKIHHVLLSRLDTFISEYDIKQIDQTYWSNIFRTCVTPYVHTLRDVIRVSNVLDLKLSLLGNEVNFCDLVAISVFQATMPQIITYIQQNKNVLVGSKSPLESIKSLDEKSKGKEEYIKEFSAMDGIVAKELLESLSTLFPKFAASVHALYEYKTDDDLRREKRLAHIDKYDLYMTLSLENLAVLESSIHQTIYSMSEEEIIGFLHRMNSNGQAVEYFLELKSRIEQIPIDRVPMFIKILIEHAYELTGTEEPSFMVSSATDYAEYLAEKLLLNIRDEKDKISCLKSILDKCTNLGMQAFSTMINKFEQSHGCPAANGNERGEKVISLDSLKTLETAFAEKLRELYVVNQLNVLDQPNSGMLCYLWEKYDKETYRERLNDLLQAPDNICRFVGLSASKRTGSEVRWIFSNDYSAYVSKDKVLESIQNVVTSPIFPTLSQNLKEIMAAFVIWNENEDVNKDIGVSLPQVHALLDKWENTK